MSEKTNTEILDRDLKEFQDEQAQDLVIDFDKFVEEQASKQITIKFEGKKFTAPADLPIGVYTRIQRKAMGGNISDSEALDILEDIFGNDFMETMKHSKASIGHLLNGLLMPLLQKWGFVGVQGHDEGKKK